MLCALGSCYNGGCLKLIISSWYASVSRLMVFARCCKQRTIPFFTIYGWWELNCSHCQNELNRESKLFPCLHSFCETCLNKEVKRKTNGNGHCPLCDEIVQLDQLTLSPILISCLKCRQMESTEWNFCLEDQIESIATNWCKNCEESFCAKCDQFHKKMLDQHELLDEHSVIESSENEKKLENWFGLIGVKVTIIWKIRTANNVTCVIKTHVTLIT